MLGTFSLFQNSPNKAATTSVKNAAGRGANCEFFSYFLSEPRGSCYSCQLVKFKSPLEYTGSQAQLPSSTKHRADSFHKPAVTNSQNWKPQTPMVSLTQRRIETVSVATEILKKDFYLGLTVSQTYAQSVWDSFQEWGMDVWRERGQHMSHPRAPGWSGGHRGAGRVCF